MKITKLFDRSREEEVVLYLHEENELSRSIEALLQPSAPLIGYGDDCAVPLCAEHLSCVLVEDGHTVALHADGTRYQLRKRLYEAEAIVGAAFVKINQSCLINTAHISRFDTTLGGSLTVVLKNGYRDYVSRRQLKAVKERMGLR